jgi:hypothetical protein
MGKEESGRMNTIRALALTSLLVAAASCAPKPAPEPVRAPVPVRSVPPPAPPPPPQPAVGWEDMAMSQGEWVYANEGPSAVYGDGLFALRCDRAGRRVLLTRSGAQGAIVVRTSYGARALPGGPGGAALPANDPFLEQMVFSRGRIAVEAEGQARLILPTWAEPARVVEECRG